jgi:hypothetical protein
MAVCIRVRGFGAMFIAVLGAFVRRRPAAASRENKGERARRRTEPTHEKLHQPDRALSCRRQFRGHSMEQLTWRGLRPRSQAWLVW